MRGPFHYRVTNGKARTSLNSILPFQIQLYLYQVFFVIRHTEKYNYNNIWVNYYYQPPNDTLHKEAREFQLATNEKGWLATGMDDIYEHRIKLAPDAGKLKAGSYKFILENIMREDPLKEVLNVGVRIEKVK
jgi:gliding motility-associated lipoprotein GldH